MVKPLALNSFPSEIMEEATLLAQIIVEQGEIAKIAEEQKENARDRLIDLGKQYCASYLASPFGSGYRVLDPIPKRKRRMQPGSTEGGVSRGSSGLYFPGVKTSRWCGFQEGGLSMFNNLEISPYYYNF